ncbi:DUF389 domain-containing protein [Streptomyces sp. NPDC088910]|uniref:DUF389 domain-containing protein n=1 Tax=Streptomyces sp. NPDC088910 TaxID=3365911 RepID=UPI0038010CAB
MLAAVIASAGVADDSTAAVIGAMIVAPPMTPILGSALTVVLSDRRYVLGSVLLVVGGALTVVATGFLMAYAAAPPDGFGGNSQVAARISPRLIDLVGALSTGTVGAFALVRSDISDTLPGVAIAISLVPPLAVTGMLLNVRRFHDAGESALLLATDVAAVVATGTVVFLLSRVRDAAREAGLHVGTLRGRPTVGRPAALADRRHPGPQGRRYRQPQLTAPDHHRIAACGAGGSAHSSGGAPLAARAPLSEGRR